MLVTHEMSIAAQAQRVVRMADGLIVEDRLIDDAYREHLMRSEIKLAAPPTTESSSLPPAKTG